MTEELKEVKAELIKANDKLEAILRYLEEFKPQDKTKGRIDLEDTGREFIFTSVNRILGEVGPAHEILKRLESKKPTC